MIPVIIRLTARERLWKGERNSHRSGDLSLGVISVRERVIGRPGMSDHRYASLCNHVFIPQISAGACFFSGGVEFSTAFAGRKMSPFCQNEPRESIVMWVHLRALGANLEVRGRGWGGGGVLSKCWQQVLLFRRRR